LAASCPYCGEGLEDDGALACPRCGMELAEPGGDPPLLLELTDEELAADDFDGIGAEDEPPVGAEDDPRRRIVPCPHCDEPVPPKRHRCPKCGRALRDLVDPEVQAAHEGFRRRVRRGAALAGMSLVALLLAVSWCGRQSRDTDRQAPRLKRSLRELVEVYGPGARRGRDNLARLFARSHEGRRVLWTGRCQRIDRGGWFASPEVWLEAVIGDVRAVVRCEMRPGSLGDLATGDIARVDGVLRAYGTAPLFTLHDAFVASSQSLFRNRKRGEEARRGSR